MKSFHHQAGNYHFAENIIRTLNDSNQYTAVYTHMRTIGMNLYLRSQTHDLYSFVRNTLQMIRVAYDLVTTPFNLDFVR